MPFVLIPERMHLLVRHRPVERTRFVFEETVK